MKPTAVVGRRVGAFLIDNVIVLAINAALFFALADSEEELFEKVTTGEIDPNANAYINVSLGDSTYSVVGSSAALYFLAAFAVWFGYWCVLQGRTGWTLGKRMLGIRLVRDDGSLPPGVLRSFVRQVMWIVDGLPYLIPYLVGFLTAKLNSRNKRVGDMVANTLVVRAQFAGEAAATGQAAPAFTPAPEPASSLPPASPDPAPTPAPEPEPAAAVPAGWHPDPSGEKRLRYWDGSSWTDQTAD